MLVPVILSGGSGARLWPLSRQSMPKQFLALLGEDTLLQRTVKRAVALENVQPPVIVCSVEQQLLVTQQLHEINVTEFIIIAEPVPRNTAPAIALAAHYVQEKYGEAAALLVMPADHALNPQTVFAAAVQEALVLAQQQSLLVTFGVQPNRVETGYGYIRKGVALASSGYRILQFIEKPDMSTAQQLIQQGDCLWNSGIFLFYANMYLAALLQYEPSMARATELSYQRGVHNGQSILVDKDGLSQSPNMSVDYAVMERTQHAAVVPLHADWTDIGSWLAVWEHAEKDASGNTTQGDVLLLETKNCLVQTHTNRLIAGLGLDQLIIVDTADATVIAHHRYAQHVKTCVEQLQQQQKTQAVDHTLVQKPWGNYESIATGIGYQVKRICVYPKGALSLQSHQQRAEHWVVVQGVAQVLCGEHEQVLKEGEQLYIPVGSKHRLRNTQESTLVLIEVQIGTYLGEDDIVRYEDLYGRV